VEEITSETGTRPHTLTPWSRVVGHCVTYPVRPAEENDSTEAIASALPNLSMGSRSSSKCNGRRNRGN
jgi:hypothetical protein